MDQLLSSFGKRGISLNLLTMKVDIEDRDHLSKYFVISEYNSVFLAGRNPVAFNGSSYLEDKSEIKVECLDSHGNSLYIEQSKASSAQFTDVSRFIISVHIYNETYNGSGKLIIVGTTKKGEIVRWIGNITIDKTLTNTSKVRFYLGPTLEARSLLYPVVDVGQASNTDPPTIYKIPSATVTLKSIVFSVSVVTGGAGYTSVPIVTIPGAVAIATINATLGIVTSIAVTDGGSGYTTNPSVTITGGGATTDATAASQITNAISSVDITDVGGGYTSPPDVSFLGVGTGATAIADLIDGKVAHVVVTNGGYGYTTNTKVNFSNPNTAVIPLLNTPISFSASFYAYAVNPHSNINSLTVDRKRTDIDYRLVAVGLSDFDISSTLFPTSSFNTQMEGSLITLNIKKILSPPSQTETIAIESNIIKNVFTIKKVINSTTIILDDSFYYQIGKDQIVTDIFDATFTSSYNFIQYNTNKESNLTYQADAGSPQSIVKDSYAEITYRNLKTYSGFVARHKLYRRSLFHPGEFQLVSDEPLGAIELLTDIITFNKAYTKLGVFYNQVHTNKYWIPSDPASISVTSQTFPINSGYITSSIPIDMDGNKYVILKTDSIGITQDNIYYPYDETEFNNLTGKSYNSNFISLKRNVLYILSTNVIIDKNIEDKSAKVSFYFTSSIPKIQLEKSFELAYGLKLGEVSTKEQTKIKYFSNKQTFYFTPSEDYYGTLIVVPYHCNVTLSEVSLKVYGDYGFSPDALIIRIPFPVNIKQEAFEIKAELFDINHSLIFSNLRANQTFDEDGVSLNAPSNFSSVFYISPDSTANISLRTTYVSNLSAADSFYLPDLQLASGNSSRLVGWVFPDGSPESNKLVYTDISNISVVPTNNDGVVTTDDYINVTTINGLVTHNGRSIIVRYTGSNAPGGSHGKRIWINIPGTKTTFS